MKTLKSFLCLTVLIIIAYVPEIYASDYTTPEARILVDREIADINIEISENSIYVPVREVLEKIGVQAQVHWDNETGVIIYCGDISYTPEYHLSNSKAMVSAEYLGQLLGYEAEYFNQYNVLSISTNSPKVAETEIYNLIPTYNGYSAEDLEWMAKIIHAEAKGEPYEAKLAVGSVILNRKASGMYPNTVKGVIFDKKNGVQFTPTANGSIYNTPSNESWLAALEVLEGKTNAENALFFINPKYAKSSWVSRNREYAFTMQNHDFYY